VLLKLRQPISIAGHTDAAPFAGPDRTNWELSAERANATRRLLVDNGFPEARVKSVTGNADRDPLLPADPLAAANRRIAILVLREAPSGRNPQKGNNRSGELPPENNGLELYPRAAHADTPPTRHKP